MLSRNPINSYQSRLFPVEEDPIWERWLRLKDRNFEDLVNLLADPRIRETFKSRALIILLSPDLSALPVEWDQREGSYLSQGKLPNLANLSPNLLSFVHVLLEYAEQTLLSQRQERTRDHMLDSCNWHWVQLLMLLPVSEAGSAWEHVQINSRVNFDYRPWKGILFEPSLPMYWKHLADSQIRTEVIQELSNEEDENGTGKYILAAYLDHIAFLLSRESLPYDQDLLADQLQFLLALDEQHKLEVLNWASILYRSLHHLDKREYRQLRKSLIRRLVAVPETLFGVHSAEDLVEAQGMLREMNGDWEVTRVLEERIREGQKYMRQVALQKMEFKAKEDDILAHMMF